MRTEPRLKDGAAGRDPIELAHGRTRASVARRGAELCRWTSDGCDLLWHGDAGVWPRHSPLLFPVVGRLRDGTARMDGRRLEMPVHGFASLLDFELVEHGPAQAALVLRSSDRTRAQYPFEFALEVRYRLHAAGIAIDIVVANRGATTMPYSVGLHPGFVWPCAAGNAAPHRIRFAGDERPLVPVITPAGLFTQRRRRLPLQGDSLPLSPALFADEALCFLDAASRSLRFEAPDASAIVVEAEGFAHWALWSPEGGGVLCIEAWTGHGDAEDFDGEFAARPSTTLLAPGAQRRHGLRLHHVPAPSP